MKLTTKRFFTISFLAVSALFFMTIAGCKNLALQDVLRVKKLTNRVADASLKKLLVTMYYQSGLNTLTLEDTKAANKYGEYVITVAKEENISAVSVKAVPKIQGDEEVAPSIEYDPGYYVDLTYDDLLELGEEGFKIGVKITSIDGSTEKVYKVVIRAGEVDDPYAS